MKIGSAILKTVYLLFLAVPTALGDAFFQGGNTGLAGIAAKAVVYFCLFFIFFAAMEWILRHFQDGMDSPRSWHRFFEYRKGNILRLALLFFAVYLCYLLVFYPGVTSGDTMYQIEDLVTGTSPMPYPVDHSNGTMSALMSDHHPVVTTLIFTLFYRIGLLAGDANRGLFLYNLLQCVCLSVLFATIVCYMDRLRVSKPIALISTVFYLSPVVASFAIFMGKDMLFTQCFILYFHVFAWLVLKPQGRGGSGRQWALLMLLSVLIALMNKKGMYIALFSNLCLVFAVSGWKKLLALPAAALPIVVVAVLMQRLLFPMFDIAPGGRQEMLSTAFQQTALSLIEHPDNYTEEEKDLFFSMFEFSQEELEETYRPGHADEIKNRFLQETGGENIQAYLKMWVSHFPREAGTYLRATLSVSGGYLAPQKAFNVYQYTAYSAALGAFSQPDKLALLRENLGSLIYWLENIPILAVISQDSFYVFWFPAFSLSFFCRRKEWRKLVLLTPLAANLLFLLIGPIIVTRYCLCQLFTFPMLLAVTAQPGKCGEAAEYACDESEHKSIH